jgi:hypothetical protein
MTAGWLCPDGRSNRRVRGKALWPDGCAGPLRAPLPGHRTSAERMAWPAAADRPIVQRMMTGGHTLWPHVALPAGRKSPPYTS